jgi:hypothetical protein
MGAPEGHRRDANFAGHQRSPSTSKLTPSRKAAKNDNDRFSRKPEATNPSLRLCGLA